MPTVNFKQDDQDRINIQTIIMIKRKKFRKNETLIQRKRKDNRRNLCVSALHFIQIYTAMQCSIATNTQPIQ